MTAPLPMRKRLQVLKLWFEGYSEDSIRRHADVGKGTVGDIVARMNAGEYQESVGLLDNIDVLREIAVFAHKRMSGDLERCFLGSAAWSMLLRLGLDPSKVKDWARMCEDLAPAGMPAKEFVRIGLWCRDIQAKLGVDLLDLPKHIESLQSKLEALQRELGALESEIQATQESATELRTELSLLQDIQGLRTERLAEESRLAEVRGRRKSALTDARITEETVEKFRVFSGTAAAKGVPVNGGSFDTLLGLVASLGPQGIRAVAELGVCLASEGLGAQEGVVILTVLRRYGFNARQAAAIVRALGARGGFSVGLHRFMSVLGRYETLEAAVESKAQELEGLKEAEAATRSEITRLQGAQTTLQANIENFRREEWEAKKRFEAREQEAEERLASIQREADERLQATETRRKDLEEYARRLGARNIEVGAETQRLNERLPALRDEVKEMTRKWDEAKGRLEAALRVEGEWAEIERAVGSAREQGQRELKELEDRIQGERDTLALADHLKRALGGDPRYARSLFAYYASEPRIPPRGGEPVPDPAAALERIVVKAFELLGDRAVRRQEFERAEERRKAESDAAARALAESKARTEELERALIERAREADRLSRELASTKQSLEWCREARRGASRAAPTKAPGPGAPRRTP